MNVAPRIVTLKKFEPKFNRTEFKVLFAIAIVDKALSQKELARRTGLGDGRIKDCTRELLRHNVINQVGDDYVYNDDTTTWRTDLLMSRNFYADSNKK